MEKKGHRPQHAKAAERRKAFTKGDKGRETEGKRGYLLKKRVKLLKRRRLRKK